MPAIPMTDNRNPTVNARIAPLGGMDVLSRMEVGRLRDATQGGLHQLLRRCALVSRTGTPGWVEATVPHIASALAWNSTHQVATALRRLAKQELIQCRHLGPTRRAYFAHPSKAIERLNEIREERL